MTLTGWQDVYDLCMASRAPEATEEQRQAAKEALLCLGPVERRVFVSVLLNQNPQTAQRLGKTDSELAGLVTRAKNKLDTEYGDAE